MQQSEHFWLVAIAWVVLVVIGTIEAARHRSRLGRVPIRIHVNGTRGKTSVVRLIAAGLRAGGKRVCAKTSGTLASITDPDGRELPVFRPAQPNIIEQLRVFARMARFGPEVVVIECMALQPHFQALTEYRMIRSTHGVLTNARADHLDVMGPGERDVARALAGTTPLSAVLYTCERRHRDLLEHAATDRGTELRAIDESEVDALTSEEMEAFQYAEHPENVALSLRLCHDLGVARETALRGMQQLEPEPGATRVSRIDFFGKDIVFVHAFAANDPESTERIWESMIEQHGEDRRRIAVVNCRLDRPDRSRQLAVAAGRWTPADHFVVMGSGTFMFVRRAGLQGIDPTSISVVEGLPIQEIAETIFERCGERALVVGMCNIHGGGLEVARYFSNRAARTEAV